MHQAYVGVMTLDEYLRAEGITETAFARKIGLSQPQVNRIRSSKSWPGREVMARIYKATDEKVKPDDFVPEVAA
jgi:transcriptional regulator with XRE-family HTH domain